MIVAYFINFYQFLKNGVLFLQVDAELDVADDIGEPALPADVVAFIEKHPELIGIDTNTRYFKYLF